MSTPLSAYGAQLQAAATKWGVPASLLAGMWKQQSRLNPNPSPHYNPPGPDGPASYDLGPFQANTHYNPAGAALASSFSGQANWVAQYLATKKQQLGSWTKALASYNGAGAPVAQTLADQAPAMAALGISGPTIAGGSSSTSGNVPTIAFNPWPSLVWAPPGGGGYVTPGKAIKDAGKTLNATGQIAQDLANLPGEVFHGFLLVAGVATGIIGLVMVVNP